MNVSWRTKRKNSLEHKTSAKIKSKKYLQFAYLYLLDLIFNGNAPVYVESAFSLIRNSFKVGRHEWGVFEMQLNLMIMMMWSPNPFGILCFWNTTNRKLEPRRKSASQSTKDENITQTSDLSYLRFDPPASKRKKWTTQNTNPRNLAKYFLLLMHGWALPDASLITS